MNLIVNTLFFTRLRQGAEIEIFEINCILDSNTEIKIFVCGNKVGVDMTYTDKPFGVFQRLHHDGEFERIGIRPANIHRIISRHSGKTWAEGDVDRGATFYFSLPISIQEI